MISKEEFKSVADETGLSPNVVEKDYVLGWLLAAINANKTLAPVWVFKGGTCLKKCYFETYRFSEDLDFTLTDDSHLDEEFLLGQFEQISEWIYEQSGIIIPADRQIFDIYDNPRGGRSCEGKVYYESYFVPGKKHIPKIKCDQMKFWCCHPQGNGSFIPIVICRKMDFKLIATTIRRCLGKRSGPWEKEAGRAIFTMSLTCIAMIIFLLRQSCGMFWIKNVHTRG